MFASQSPPVRSTSIAVLSLNLPEVGDDEPLATVVVPSYFSPSCAGAPPGPPGLTKRATHWSPNAFAVPAGSPDASAPKNARPWLSHAITGSPAVAVRARGRRA